MNVSPLQSFAASAHVYTTEAFAAPRRVKKQGPELHLAVSAQEPVQVWTCLHNRELHLGVGNSVHEKSRKSANFCQTMRYGIPRNSAEFLAISHGIGMRRKYKIHNTAERA